MAQHALGWFEISVTDFERARAFYEEVLGVTLEVLDLGTMLMAEKAARVFIGASRIGGPLFLPPQYVARLEGRSEEGPRASTIKL